jgi:membrane-bound serine protease (ClpP class)
MKNKILLLLAIIGSMISDISSASSVEKTKVYKFEINQSIDKSAWRLTKKACEHARKLNADILLLRLNTYGGLVDVADSIRTALLNFPKPVLVFIDNNAASAGALISISADSIYMRKGASIGAATVVDQEGKVVPDKYQSYMRGIMRSTAEAHGKDTVINGKDTTYIWHRDPKIAEAMVDPRTYIKGINDSGKVLTFTTSEAIKYGFCEGEAENIDQVLSLAGINDYEILEYKITAMDSVIGFLLNPVIQGILIMIIVAGIYFEFQSPGIGFALFAAIGAALLYFAPLYLEGLANNWEILMFIAGIILLAIEIFAIPGFGVTGILGISFILIGLTMALIDNVHVKPFEYSGMVIILRAFFLVITSIVLSFAGSLYVSGKLIKSKRTKIALSTSISSSDGFVGVDQQHLQEMKGKIGVTKTLLRPSGTVEIEGRMCDAKSETGYIEAGQQIIVTRSETGQIYVKPFKG